jgi:pre-mRNA-processing factor 40
MSKDIRTSAIPDDILQRIFNHLVNKKRRHTSSRESRKSSDAFRSRLRHMQEITHRSTWDEIRPLVQDTEEFIALENEEERLAVFEKVSRRLKEKRDEQRRHHGESDRRREKEDYRDSRHDSRSRRRYDDEEGSRERSRPRSNERLDRDGDYRRSHSRSRSYTRRDELNYGGDESKDGRSKRRTDEELHTPERKVTLLEISLN